jgi:hypothetical protein
MKHWLVMTVAVAAGAVQADEAAVRAASVQEVPSRP